VFINQSIDTLNIAERREPFGDVANCDSATVMRPTVQPTAIRTAALYRQLRETTFLEMSGEAWWRFTKKACLG